MRFATRRVIASNAIGPMFRQVISDLLVCRLSGRNIARRCEQDVVPDSSKQTFANMAPSRTLIFQSCVPAGGQNEVNACSCWLSPDSSQHMRRIVRTPFLMSRCRAEQASEWRHACSGFSRCKTMQALTVRPQVTGSLTLIGVLEPSAKSRRVSRVIGHTMTVGSCGTDHEIAVNRQNGGPCVRLGRIRSFFWSAATPGSGATRSPKPVVLRGCV